MGHCTNCENSYFCCIVSDDHRDNMSVNRNSILGLIVFATFIWALGTLAESCVGSQLYANEIDGKKLPKLVDFNYHIKPIFSDRCFACHGPDDNARKAEFRLDVEEVAYAQLKSGAGKAIHPRRPSKSEMIKRISSKDPDYQMPPAESNLEISDYEIALIEKWIDQGAKWKKHWSLIPPERAAIPENTAELWKGMNEIDHFILSKANEQNLTIQTEASKERLLRRVYLDVTGLPPSVKEIDSFLQNQSPDAFERLVDGLLTTEAHAERLAMEWMDVARYADSHGLHADGWRNMWPWRDWVIKAFGDNMSYDEFIRKQLAGDMLPNAQRDDIIATAFNRNHTMTAEGGAIDEEWRLNYVFDRSETMSTILLGMTVGCAKCHDHKYDPISQKEYYQLASFFNNVKELGMTGDDGNYGPLLYLPDEETEEKLKALDEKISGKVEETERAQVDIDAVKKYISRLEKSRIPDARVAYLPFNRSEISYVKDKNEPMADESLARKRVFFDGNKNYFTKGDGELKKSKFGNAMSFGKDFSELFLEKVGFFEMSDEFSVSAWINTSKDNPKKTQTIMGNNGDKNTFWRGWELYLDQQNHLNARLISSLLTNMIHIRSKKKIEVDEWNQVGFTYDGSAKAEGLRLFENGTAVDFEVLHNNLSKSMLPINWPAGQILERPLTVGESGRNHTGENGIFSGLIDEIQIFEKELSPYEIAKAARFDFELDDQSKKIISDRLAQKSSLKKLLNLRKQRLEVFDEVSELMVMQEHSGDHKMHTLFRGEYDKPMEEVSAGTPQAILDFPEGFSKNRLGLVDWLFDKKNPLTARVTVNRYWQMIFGRGLVSTPEDFGMQGSLPSHPELLDWLAMYFVESGWDLRHLVKKMVMSATYRQSSICTEEQRQKDPDNIYLARGSSYRLPAEMIRDNALAASGLLNNTVGGESVRPYQPEGLWIEKGNFSAKLLRYKETKGDSLYRRSMYTFVKRTSPHPMMTTFDAPPRDVCTVKRENTNTPLQALVLLNDPQFVEAAKVLAQRMQFECGELFEKQIEFAFRSCTGRSLDMDEYELFVKLYKEQLEKYEKEPEKAKQLLEVGEFVMDDRLDVSETAALTVVTNTMLNHDDAYMKR